LCPLNDLSTRAGLRDVLAGVAQTRPLAPTDLVAVGDPSAIVTSAGSTDRAHVT
jgi:hypothetical protein